MKTDYKRYWVPPSHVMIDAIHIVKSIGVHIFQTNTVPIVTKPIGVHVHLTRIHLEYLPCF